KTSTLSHGDTEAFRQAFAQLHSELRQVRATLAIERLDRVLGPSARRREQQLKSESIVSDRLLQSLKDVSTFSNQVKAQMSMPRLVDLNHPSEAAQSQLVATKLTQSKSLRKLTELRTKISATMQEDGWGNDVVRAIDRGENVFGWQPPEMERSPLLLSRVTLGAGGAKTSSVPSLPTIPLLLNRSEVKQLTQALVC
uniref:Uncharacterized protein n=1 Tax=Globisporangium ultimum (strain ATCC 200006 / CBS 805.95 / DAOM BR144) TaxID=431595 RepID=K3WUU5_GLOUD